MWALIASLLVTLGAMDSAPRNAVAPVEFAFEGVVESVDGAALDGSVAVGTRFCGWLAFDPAAPDVDPAPHAGGYPQPSPPASFGVRVGGYAFRSLPDVRAGTRLGLLVYDDRALADPATARAGHDELYVQSRDNEATGDFAGGPNLGSLVTFGWQLSSAGDPLAGSGLPAAPPDLAQWSFNRFEIRGDKDVVGPPYFTIRGSVTRISAEPDASGPCARGAALLALLPARRRRRRAGGREALAALVALSLVGVVRAQSVDRRVTSPTPEEELRGITQSETTLVAVGSTVCVAWNDLNREPTGVMVNGFGDSADDGATFRDRGMFPFGPVWPGDEPAALSVPFADPTLGHRSASTPGDARFLFASLDGRSRLPFGARSILLYDSVDCSSFAYRGRITSPNSELYGGVDKEIMAVDNNELLPDGRRNPFYRRIYVGVSQLLHKTLWVLYSDDPDAEAEDGWARRSAVSVVGENRQVHGAWPVVAPNGDVYVAFSEFNYGGDDDVTFRIARSTNGGAGWTLGVDVATAKPFPRRAPLELEPCTSVPALNGDIRNPPFPQIAITADPGAPAGYVIHAVYQYDPGAVGGDVADVFYRRSLTGAGLVGAGPAWEPERRLNDDATSTDQWNPALAAGPSGYVAASWYDRRHDPAGNLWFDRYVVTSADGGVRWSRNVRVTDVSSPVSRNRPHVDGAAGCYHGDYDQLAITGTTVHVVWSDDRRVGPGCPGDPADPNDPYQSACPNPDVYYDQVSDFDGDGRPDRADSCPTVVDQRRDLDADGVDDACDTCATPNPVLTGSTAGRTVVSGQLDDDGDGVGNACDFDYDQVGGVISVDDFNQIRASISRSVTTSSCGTQHDMPCGVFDHTGSGRVISTSDFNLAKAALARVLVTSPGSLAPQPVSGCGEACTAPLSGPLGSGEEIPGKAICVGVACE